MLEVKHRCIIPKEIFTDKITKYERIKVNQAATEERPPSKKQPYLKKILLFKEFLSLLVFILSCLILPDLLRTLG